jgi:glycosyltransferase involved in cell wall biosynthesis
MISVILSTYLKPDYLRKSLWGYECQTLSDFEIVIADDGSTSETSDVIEEFTARRSLRITHTWQPDRGFDKTTILNKAISKASGDYLVFSDGDCIPRMDFLATHHRQARPNAFLSGGAEYLTMVCSSDIDRSDISEGRVFNRRWLNAHGVQLSPFAKIAVPRFLAPVRNLLTPTRRSFNGHNSSAWKRDVLAINGFDERMGYGGEDREVGERLINSGLRGISVRYSAICAHLFHDRPYATAKGFEINDGIRAITRNEKRVWTHHGVNKDKAG